MDKQEMISSFKTEAHANILLAKEKLSNLSDTQLRWKPAPERWSISQCVEHINISNRFWIPELMKIITRGKKSDNYGEYERTGFGGFIIRNLLAPKVRKVRTVKKLSPPDQLDSKKVMEEYLILQKQWEELMEKIYGYDIVGNRVPSPIFSLITYRLGNAIELNNVHTRRHLNQAINVMKEPDFPAM
jgi:hypothetical protein